MIPFQIHFEIIEDTRCPFYEVGEQLILSNKALICPGNKETCLILVREMTQLLFRFLPVDHENLLAEKPVFTCSGCTGLIKFRPMATSDNPPVTMEKKTVLGGRELRLVERIRSFPLIQLIPDDELKAFVGRFHQETIHEGKVLIQKGESNLHLYMILSGQMLVMDGAMVITSLGPGEICGEMSYLGDDVAAATVRALSDTEVLAVSSVDFNYLLDRLPALQNHMARLLARRLNRANKARAEDFASCMQGRLQDMAPAELLQIFHMNSKTGVLSLEFPRGMGEVFFREGGIIHAHYQGQEKKEAIFAMLGEHEGTYRFTLGLSPQAVNAAEVGDFMKLLMEGMQRLDELRAEKQDSRGRL
jgi:CRP/FNR family transcriptional regulator, cyclic AMP receptor protein